MVVLVGIIYFLAHLVGEDWWVCHPYDKERERCVLAYVFLTSLIFLFNRNTELCAIHYILSNSGMTMQVGIALVACLCFISNMVYFVSERWGARPAFCVLDYHCVVSFL